MEENALAIISKRPSKKRSARDKTERRNFVTEKAGKRQSTAVASKSVMAGTNTAPARRFEKGESRDSPPMFSMQRSAVKPLA